MAQTTLAETVVAVHSTLSNPEKMNCNRYGIDVAAQVLGELGVGLVFIPKGGYDIARMVNVHEAHAAKDGVLSLANEPRTLAVGHEVRAVRAYTSVGIPNWLDEAVPVINGPVLRNVGKDKFGQVRLFEADMAKTIFVASGTAVDGDTLSTIEGNKVVVKPNNGASSEHVAVTDKTVVGVEATLANLRKSLEENGYTDKGFVVQEYDPAAPIEAETLFKEANELVREAGSNGRPELRVYCFADTVNNELTIRPYPMYRLFAGTDKNMLFPMDELSLPSGVLSKAVEATANILAQTGSMGGLVVVDMYASSVEGGFRFREINLGNPVTGPTIAMKWLPDSLGARVAEHASRGHGVRLGEQLATLALGRKASM